MDRDLWKRLFRHRSAQMGLAILVVILASAAAGLLLYSKAEFANRIEADRMFLAPGGEHWLGTDNLGRDVFEGLCIGAITSLYIAGLTILVAMTLGTALGAVAAYAGGRFDMGVMRLVDILQAFPSILLAITVMCAFGRGTYILVIAIALPILPQFTRQVRAAVLVVRELDYVQAALALGAKPGRVVFRTILPNIMGPIIVMATLSIGGAILNIAGLSFLGLGVPPGEPEWGTMLKNAWDKMSISYDEWWAIVFPGLAIALTVLGFNLFGDGLRDTLDPKMKKAR